MVGYGDARVMAIRLYRRRKGDASYWTVSVGDRRIESATGCVDGISDAIRRGQACPYQDTEPSLIRGYLSKYRSLLAHAPLVWLELPAGKFVAFGL